MFYIFGNDYKNFSTFYIFRLKKCGRKMAPQPDLREFVLVKNTISTNGLEVDTASSTEDTPDDTARAPVLSVGSLLR